VGFLKYHLAEPALSLKSSQDRSRSLTSSRADVKLDFQWSSFGFLVDVFLEEPRLQPGLFFLTQEIEFDRETGKLSDADYRELKAKYSAVAVAAIREEEQESSGDAEALDDEAERIVQEASKRSSVVCTSCGPRPEHDAVFCSSCGRPLKYSGAAACPECGSGLPADAKYCAACGATVAAPVVQR